MFFFNPVKQIISVFQKDQIDDYQFKKVRKISPYYKRQSNNLKILVLDGGGIRGILPVLALIEIQRQLSTDLYNYIDIFGGTSTGGIIAVCLNLQMDLFEILKIYENAGQIMFKNSNNIIFQSIKPKYDNTEYQKLLDKILGKQMLSDVKKSLFLISCNTIGELQLFSSDEAKNQQNQDVSLKLAVLSTSAAPTFFPPVQYQNYGLVDGGVIRNNPGMTVISNVINKYGWDNAKQASIISIGTGRTKGPLYDDLGQGLLYWAKAFPQINISSSSQCTHQELEKLYPNNYVRIQWELEEEIELDKADEKSINKLKNIFKQQYNQIKEKIQKAIQLLKN